MATYWAVESHHASVKVGDCAIHMLVKIYEERDKPIQREAQRAVLIDGGTSSVNPQLTACKNAVESLVNKLTILYQLKPLKLHTVVVSHWDEDHYGGLEDLIWKDMLKVVTENKKPSEVLTYLLWETIGTTEIPKTYFYCPNEAETRSKSGKTKSLNGLSPHFRRGTGPNAAFIEVCTDKKPDPNKITGTWKPFAILRSAELSNNLFNCLGANFFENTLLASNPGKTTPAQLMQKNPPGTLGWPGMYCIGTMNQTFSSGGVDIVPEGVTKTNQYSIAAVILWGNSDNPPRCSHYFAGDADDARETMYLSWLSTGGVKKTTSMKLSHHGSRSSTPRMAYDFGPTNIIISNPTGLYFHPGKLIQLQ